MTSTRGPQFLSEHEDRWVTAMGAWFPGERVVLRGKDLFQDLKDLSWMGLFLYGVTGRMPDERTARLFEGMWMIGTSFPDPRLWNNRVAALAGTSRSTAALGVGAATAASEAIIYGHRPITRSMDFLLRTQKGLDGGSGLGDLVMSELRKYKGIPGYGRPITRKDERIEPLLSLAQRLGFADGPHVKLAFQVEEFLLEGRWRLHMNIAALAAALAADRGLSAEEYYQMAVLSFSAGMIPCYLDARQHPQGAFFPMRCDRIAYKGAPRRCWNGSAQ